jgi:transmembrane sensor
LAEKLGTATRTQQLTEEAAAWLAALDAGTADRAAFEAWRDLDPRHAVAFAEVARTWGELDRLRPLRSQSHIRVPTVSRRTMIRGAVAATALAMTATVAWPWLDEASAETGVGERRTVRLPGGVLVELNTQTVIRWRRLGDPDTLWLERGEVALTVPQDRQIAIEYGRAVTLGSGAFNLRKTAGMLEVLSMSPSAQTAGRRLSAGAVAVVTDATVAVRPSSSGERDRAKAWRRGEIVFAGDTLAFVLAEYNRYLDRPLMLGAPELADLRLGGRFASSDPHPFLAALADGFGLAAIDSGSGPIVIRRQKKSVGQ